MKLKLILFLTIISGVMVSSCKKHDAPEPVADWYYDSTNRYPVSMTAVVLLPQEIQDHVGNQSDKLAAFIDGECRGIASIIKVNGQKQFFIMIHGTATEKSRIKFKYFSGLYAYYYETHTFLEFVVDGNYGTADEPKILDIVKK